MIKGTQRRNTCLKRKGQNLKIYSAITTGHQMSLIDFVGLSKQVKKVDK
jgi:hypothetical protein